MSTKNQNEEAGGPPLNNAKPDQASEVQTIMAVVVPVEIFDQVKNALKCLPMNQVEMLLHAMAPLHAQPVNMQRKPGA